MRRYSGKHLPDAEPGLTLFIHSSQLLPPSLGRSIPANVIRSLNTYRKKEWLFAYPVKDCRGVLDGELHEDSEAGDHFPVLPWSKDANIAYLFFTQNGDVVIVPDDRLRDASLPARSPESFSLSKCAACTILNTEEQAGSKNEFVLFFAFKPNETFAPHFDHHSRACSGLGFELMKSVFVDNRASLKETDFTHNVKRFNEFIRSMIQSPGLGRVGRVLNATSAFTHVTIGIPRGKPSQIVEDPTELLDYKISEPEKSCCAANDSTSASSLRPKKATFVHRVISVGDFARLDKGECLSDATIDFYSSWLRETHPEKCRGIYFASSFFFMKLWSQQRDSKESTDFSYMHKWNSIDIFTFDRVMFPVNLNYHWSLIVLENPCALLQPKGTERCRLLYMDSLKTWDQQISQLFTCWVTWMHMRQTSQGELTPLVNFVTIMLEGKKQVFISSRCIARSCG